MQDVRKKIKALFVWMAEVKEELSKPQTLSLADLLIAYYNQRNAGAWSNKARTGNLKQFAETVNYLTENKLLTLEDLQERLSSVSEEFEALSGSMKKKSARIKELQELIREGENYQRLKPVHTELNNIKFKKQREKFETSHDAELRLFYAAWFYVKKKYKLNVNSALKSFIMPHSFQVSSISSSNFSHVHSAMYNYNDYESLLCYKMSLYIQILVYTHAYNP